MPLLVPEYVLNVQRARLAEFFLCFSRFEFALKASGFAHNGQWGAEVNWEKFAAESGSLMLPTESPALQAAIYYLVNDPPKRQVFSQEALRWELRTPPKNWSEMRVLLFHVQGVRNNLVHGAKFLANESGDPERDLKLLEAASCVIAECLRLCPKTHHAFDSEAL